MEERRGKGRRERIKEGWSWKNERLNRRREYRLSWEVSGGKGGGRGKKK